MLASRVVIKLGGSVLYSHPSWIDQLEQTLAPYQSAAVSLIVGGGDIVEGVRTLHKLYPHLEQSSLHWNCVSLLDSTCEIAHQLLPLDGMIATPEHFSSWNRLPSRQTKWVNVSSFYSRDRLGVIPPHWHPSLDWNTTTDALAVFLALQWNASQVLLLKSCDINPDWSLEQAAALGVVDSETPRLAKLLIPGAVRLVPFA